jgi:hypothetical protein
MQVVVQVENIFQLADNVAVMAVAVHLVQLALMALQELLIQVAAAVAAQ